MKQPACGRPTRFTVTVPDPTTSDASRRVCGRHVGAIAEMLAGPTLPTLLIEPDWHVQDATGLGWTDPAGQRNTTKRRDDDLLRAERSREALQQWMKQGLDRNYGEIDELCREIRQ